MPKMQKGIILSQNYRGYKVESLLLQNIQTCENSVNFFWIFEIFEDEGNDFLVGLAVKHVPLLVDEARHFRENVVDIFW